MFGTYFYIDYLCHKKFTYMKRSITLILILLAFLGLKDIRAQETTIVPSMDLYDTGMMNMYIGAMRDAAAIDNQMAERMQPVIQDTFDKYNRGEYWSCINTVTSIFNSVTFYKRQYWLYSPLYYVRGLSYMAVGQEDNGIANLVAAKDANNSNAASALQSYFSQYCSNAYQELNSKRYYNCLQQVNKALSTTYYNYSIYEIAGAANEGLNSFDEAKKYYKLAKKNGSPNVSQMLKQLNVHKKKYKQSHK